MIFRYLASTLRMAQCGRAGADNVSCATPSLHSQAGVQGAQWNEMEDADPLTLAVATVAVGAQDMKVMTRNIYIGAPINPLLGTYRRYKGPFSRRRYAASRA